MTDHTASREPELLTITEAAELLRAPVATLRYWRHLGTGPRSFRLGRRVLYRSDDLRAWSTPSTARTAAVNLDG
jgi:excisionase family DNA binding protein